MKITKKQAIKAQKIEAALGLVISDFNTYSKKQGKASK